MTLNGDLAEELRPVQGCITKFSLTLDVVHRLMTSVPAHKKILNAPSDDYVFTVQAREVFATVNHKVENQNVVFLKLRVIVDVFAPLQHPQTLLEASYKIALPFVLPVLHIFK